MMAQPNSSIQTNKERNNDTNISTSHCTCPKIHYTFNKRIMRSANSKSSFIQGASCSKHTQQRRRRRLLRRASKKNNKPMLPILVLFLYSSLVVSVTAWIQQPVPHLTRIENSSSLQRRRHRQEKQNSLFLTFSTIPRRCSRHCTLELSATDGNHDSTGFLVSNRLDADSLRALEYAQRQATTVSQSNSNSAATTTATKTITELTNSWLLVGLASIPSSPVAETLSNYKIYPHRIIRSILLLLQTTTTRCDAPPTLSLSDFANVSTPTTSSTTQFTSQELPLSISLQRTLLNAQKLAQAMGSSRISPHHIFLALMDFKETEEDDGTTKTQVATTLEEFPDNETLQVLFQLDSDIRGDVLCWDLLETLRQYHAKQPPSSTNVQSTTPSSNAATNTDKTSTKGKEAVPSGAAPPPNSSDPKAKALALLQESAIDLTQLAREGKLDKVQGRDAEIQACFQTLVRRRKNNVCLIGEAGVGKTCIVEGLAQILVSKDCPSFLQGQRIVSLEVGALLAGTKFRGEFEERLRNIIEILTKSKTKSILFIDEIHNLVGAGGNGGGNLDASNILKPFLSRGQLQVIGATTITEYNQYIAKDAALERRFQPVLIREPSVEETIDILQAVVPFYQAHHKVEYTDGSLQAAALLSERYINDRFLPDKAIDILDEAGAMANLQYVGKDSKLPVVTETSVTDIISQWTNIPVGKLEMDEMDRLQSLEENLEKRVKGQERAVRTVAKAIRRARTGIRNPRRPVASFLFCGPTGTGKTELCKALADTYFGSERDLVRIDMSEYIEKSAVTRLTGPPPGLVGYEEGGQLTEAVRRAPHSVVLLDELEKAHGDVLNLLLQVLEDGILTDGKGRTISFKNTVLIMTSNIGSERILDAVKKHEVSNESGTQQKTIEYTRLSRIVTRELENALKPEFLNRIDDIIVFQPLSHRELELIALMMVNEITARAKAEKALKVNVSKELLDRIVDLGSAVAGRFGARPMRRTVQRVLEDSISDAVVKNFLVEGDEAIFHLKKIGINGDSIPGISDDTLMVTVNRFRDDKTLEIPIEDLGRDLASDESTEEEDDGVPPHAEAETESQTKLT